MRDQTIYADCLADSGAVWSGEKRTAGVIASLKDMPEDERPRERLACRGCQSLSDGDLMAIVLGTGTKGKGVTALAGEVLTLLDGKNEIPTVQELCALSGMGFSKACTVVAMLELGRRRWGAAGCQLKHPSEIFAAVRHNADRKQERFISISLNGAHEVLAVRVVTVGLVNRAIVHPREVFADIIEDRAAAFVVAHNHPSGRLLPSREDDEITERLKSAASILGLQFLDHLIFSQSDFYSYRQNGRLTP